jgi:Nuclease-related domain/UvrD-like helicase C-terminal domain/AAA domain
MRLIPSYIEENTSPGERIVFSNLQNTTNDWVALHSLDLAPFNNDKRTEIDFVVLMPKYGIFCIEIKSQKNIYFDGSRWQPETIKNSPFKQALDARYAFHRRLKMHSNGKYKHVPVLHCCIFPLSDFYLDTNVSIQRCEVMDRRVLDACKTVDDFCKALTKMFVGALENDPQVNKLQNILTNEEVQEIVEFCYPVRKRKPELSMEIQRRQTELEEKLVIQQKPILNLVDLNDRVLVEGGAGTGKSMIGIEVAKRKADKGLRVACLCFNQLIGKWMENQVARLSQPNLIAGTVHSVLFRITGITVPINADSEWWDQEAPELIEEKLTDPEFAGVATFDYLVIDEAQDILARPALWNCLKLFIEGGLDRGKFLIMGDFLNQSLTINNNIMEKNLLELKNNTARWMLDENCRNYKQIGEVALALSASNRNTWSGYMRVGGALDDWKLYPYDNDVEQVQEIMNFIQLSRNNGFKDSDITLLSFRTVEKSVLESLVLNGLVMEKATELGSTTIRYSTINAYKGMENKIIIITDIALSPQNIELDRKLFYTGVTRATEKLCIMCRKSATNVLVNWISQQVSVL